MISQLCFAIGSHASAFVDVSFFVRGCGSIDFVVRIVSQLLSNLIRRSWKFTCYHYSHLNGSGVGACTFFPGTCARKTALGPVAPLHERLLTL